MPDGFPVPPRDREPLTSKTMTHVEELRHVASLDQCSWDYAQKLMRSSADEIDRLNAKHEAHVSDAQEEYAALETELAEALKANAPETRERSRTSSVSTKHG